MTPHPPSACCLGRLAFAHAVRAQPRLRRRTRTRSISTRRARRSPPSKRAEADKNLTDADLQRLRAQNDPLGIALQAAIADLTPRLAASAKRLAELTPKIGQEAAPRPTSRPRSSPARSRSTTRSTPICAPRARCCCRSTTSRPASARRGGDLFARETFARSSCVFNPQLWRTCARERRRRRAPSARSSATGSTRSAAGSRRRRRSAWSARSWRSRSSRRRSAGSPAASSIAIPPPNRPTGCAARSPRHGLCSCSPRCRSPRLGVAGGALDVFDLSDPRVAGRARRRPRRGAPADRRQRPRAGHAVAPGRGVAARSPSSDRAARRV